MGASVSTPSSGDCAAPSPVFASWAVVMESLPMGISLCGVDGVIVCYNRQAVAIWGRTPSIDGQPTRFSGALRSFAGDGRQLAADELPMAEVLRTGLAIHDREVVFEREDGRRISTMAHIEPLHDAEGALVGAVKCFRDLSSTPAVRPRNDAWVRQVFEHSPVAIYSTDADGVIQNFNHASERLWGRAPVVGRDRWCGSQNLFHPDGRPMPLDACPMASALKSGVAQQGLEALFKRPDGSRGAFMAYPTLLRDADGRLMGAVNMLVDISERKMAEDRQKTLIDELNHRVKNTLASVQSLAAQSLRGDGRPEDMRAQFEARILALSRAHNQLAERHWQDANLLTLVEDVLAPFLKGGRVNLEGEPVTVSARAAVTLSMVLHELATNAAKYGALSIPEGRLWAQWQTLDGDRLVLHWREAGGPVVAAPTQRGFGTRFISGAVANELGGRIDLDFDPAGLTCRIEAPL